jgi:prevent-host-death family protein
VKRTVKTAQVRQKLGDLLDRIEERRVEFVIERRGKALAALVPMEKLERLQRAAEVELLDALDGHARRLTRSQIDDLGNVAKHRNRPTRGKKRS